MSSKLPLLALFPAILLSAPQADIFRAGEGGYASYRIPALLATPKGTLLAFCEGRRHSASDTGDIDLLLRRSFDQGKTWQPLQTIADFGEDTVGNPTPVVERKTGAILLLMTSNPGKVSERQTTTRDRTIWIARSTDDGKTWTKPAEITSQVKLPDWTWYATGPGNGIQLRSGRLIIPCDHNLAGERRFAHIIYSDDRGTTWKIGGIAEEKTNESAIVELKNGELLFNMRSYHGKNRRAVQRSKDGGLTFEPLAMDETLIEPVCQASMIMGPKGSVLFSNPADTRRTHLTVRMSHDGGHTWAASKLIHEGPAAYSSLAMLRGNQIGLLFELGEKGPYERIAFTHFDTRWLQGKSQ